MRSRGTLTFVERSSSRAAPARSPIWLACPKPVRLTSARIGNCRAIEPKTRVCVGPTRRNAKPTLALNLGELWPFPSHLDMVAFSDAAKVMVDAFVTPVWVVDVERADLIWANRPALTLFDAPTLEELLGRELLRGANAFLAGELGRLSSGAR